MLFVMNRVNSGLWRAVCNKAAMLPPPAGGDDAEKAAAVFMKIVTDKTKNSRLSAIGNLIILWSNDMDEFEFRMMR
jgi:hypothetical protein